MKDIERQKDEDFLYEFRSDLADKVIDFAEQLYIPDLNSKLVLLPWHKFIYYNLFGWVHKLDNNRRRFRTSYCEVARKNSKTTSLLFPIILYDFITTNSAESFFVSKDGNQSAKTYTELKQIFIETFNIDKNTFITDSGIRIGSKFIQFFSSETRGTDSYKNSCSVIDEFHHYDNDKVITSFKYGGRARINNLVLIITSAGNNISSPCYAENEKARKVLNGLLTDETYFTIIFAYDEGDDWKDKKNFIKANPSLGTIIRPEILDIDLADALITPSHQADFKSKTCGIWQASTSNWISLQKWDTEKRNREINIKEFNGQFCCAGLDLSSINDFTAYTKCFEREGLYYFFHKFYIPAETINERYRSENININEWIHRGIVTAIPGNVIDYDFIKEDIISDAGYFNITELCYDKWQSNKLIDSLEENLPHTMFIQYDQSLKQMTNPTKQFEKFIMEDKIIDPNPVMKWMVTNAVIRPDANNNYKVMKQYKSSTQRVDGVITSIMALDRCVISDNKTLVNKDFNSILNLF
ncbi:MAG: terminase large subunit [Treponema sp.]|nr:terminase large subunit [Treponema sp.]